MCRMAARTGAEAPLSLLLRDLPHALYEQAYRPRMQHQGSVNVDGTGVVWWPPGESEPLRYASDLPPWSDPNLPHLAPRLRATAQLAAVRSGTPGLPYGPSAAAPFLNDGVAVAHNGRIDGFPGPVGRELLAELPDDLLGRIGLLTDSVVLALTVARRRREDPGVGLGGAVAATVSEVERRCVAAGRAATLTMLACDGARIVGVRAAIGSRQGGTRRAATLFTTRRDGTALAASEPLDDVGDWTELPDRHLVELTPGQARLTPLPSPRPAPSPNPGGAPAQHPTANLETAG